MDQHPKYFGVSTQCYVLFSTTTILGCCLSPLHQNFKLPTFCPLPSTPCSISFLAFLFRICKSWTWLYYMTPNIKDFELFTNFMMFEENTTISAFLGVYFDYITTVNFPLWKSFSSSFLLYLLFFLDFV